MKQVAEKEAKALVVSKIHRRFFNYDEQVAPTFDMAGIGAPVGLDGLIIPLYEIPRADVSTLPPAGYTQDVVSLRLTNVIRITGFTVGIRSEWQAGNFPATDYEFNNLHYAVVGWRSQLMPYTSAQDIPAPVTQNAAVLPANQRPIVLQDHQISVSKILPLKPWGYSALLDNRYVPTTTAPDTLAENLWESLGPYDKVRTLYRGVIRSGRLRGVGDRPPNIIRKVTKYIKLKRPITMKYVETDVSGETILGPWQYFLVMRSLVPYMGGDEPANSECIPNVSGFIKCHFIEP